MAHLEFHLGVLVHHLRLGVKQGEINVLGGDGGRRQGALGQEAAVR
jgi:hypothetical protein